MAMQVETSHNFILFSVVLNFVFYIANLWMKYFRRVFPTPIQVHACNITTTVAINYSIDVYHRKYYYRIVFEDVTNPLARLSV